MKRLIFLFVLLLALAIPSASIGSNEGGGGGYTTYGASCEWYQQGWTANDQWGDRLTCRYTGHGYSGYQYVY